MDEREYAKRSSEAFTDIESMFDDVDADDCDLERSGDVIRLIFRGGRACIINTQRPSRQIWLAANARAWHFSFDSTSGQWLDDKHRGDELFDTVVRLARELGAMSLVAPRKPNG